MKSGSPPCPDRLPGGRLEFNPSRHAIPDCFLVCLGGTAADVRTIGRVAEERLPSGNVRYYLDFGRVKGLGRVRIYGGFKTREDAAAVLAHIQGEIVREGKRGVSLADVLSRRVPQGSVPRQVQTRLAAWLEVKTELTEAGDLSPTYLRELQRWARRTDHFGWWWGKSIFEIDEASLEDWGRWLAKRNRRDRRGLPTDEKLLPQTRRKILGGFSSFVHWLVRRRELERLPLVPEIPTDDYEPTIIPVEAQDRIIGAIPDEMRGAFLAMGRAALRPGEARALNIEDFRDGWLTVGHAMKGTTHKAPRRSTKTRTRRRVPCDAELRA